MFSAIALIGFVSAPIGGRLADRIGRTPIIALGSATSALAIAALPWARGRTSFYAAMAVWDVGESMLIAASTALAADITPPDQRGSQTSLLNQVSKVGQIGQISQASRAHRPHSSTRSKTSPLL